MKGWTMKDHEKLIAFMVLVVAIGLLVLLASTFDRGLANDIVVQGKLRIIDSSIAGLLTILGMAAQALFRVGEPVKIANKPNEPVPVEAIPEAPVNEELPEHAR